MRTYESNETVPAFPPEVEAMLAHERIIEEEPEIVRARLVAHARESLRFSEPGYPNLARPSRRPLWLAAAAGVSLTASVALGVQFFHRAAPPSPRPAVVQSVANSNHAGVPAVAPPPVAEEREPAPRSTASVRAEMKAELRFLDRARQADVRGDYFAVLSLTAEHERRFPHGRLAEDREVLRLRAYVGLGRGSEARATAARFRRLFPKSVLLPKIDDLSGSVP